MTGEFSKELVQKAWVRSGGKCECEESGHGHAGKHNKTLIKAFRGDSENKYGWEAYSVSALHLDNLSDCKIICWNPCFKAMLKKQVKRD